MNYILLVLGLSISRQPRIKMYGRSIKDRIAFGKLISFLVNHFHKLCSCAL